MGDCDKNIPGTIIYHVLEPRCHQSWPEKISENQYGRCVSVDGFTLPA